MKHSHNYARWCGKCSASIATRAASVGGGVVGSGNYEDSGRNVTVTNRFENLSFAAGQILRVGWIDGEWQPTAADCE